MHPNPAFREDDQARALVMAQDRAFGILTVTGPDGVLASHIPFVIDGAVMGMHLVRSNPIARLLKDGPLDALMIVSGPDAYISPDWYGIDDQVPTWNYVAVHLRGRLSLLPDETLKPHLDHVSGHLEKHFLPKKIWTMDKMTPEAAARFMRQIVPVAMEIGEVASTWKLNQNKDDDVRLRAADAVEASPIGAEQHALANLMRDVPPKSAT
ncbi:MAG: FMN-binding negative transcriptional regulator [Pseudomonadota bacterium]